MQLPQPTEFHEFLAGFVGHWAGDEILYPSPWAPEQRTARGEHRTELIVDGMFLRNEYTESRDSKVVFRGYGIYGYDVKRNLYTMHWFDSMGMPPQETTGTRDGDTLVFVNANADTRGRYLYRLIDADHFSFRIEVADPTGDFRPMMHGEYERIAAN